VELAQLQTAHLGLIDANTAAAAPTQWDEAALESEVGRITTLFTHAEADVPKADSRVFKQASAEQLEQWVIAVGQKQMSREDFNELVASQTIVAKNFVLSQALDAQQRAEELTIDTIKLAASKLVPVLIALV